MSRLTISNESMGGLVLGSQFRVVKPPVAAALEPVSTVSLYSYPGSRRCTWQSMRPGITYLLVASITLALALALISFEIALILPSFMRILLQPSIPAPGSTTWPPLINNSLPAIFIRSNNYKKSFNGHCSQDCFGLQYLLPILTSRAWYSLYNCTSLGRLSSKKSFISP